MLVSEMYIVSGYYYINKFRSMWKNQEHAFAEEVSGKSSHRFLEKLAEDEACNTRNPFQKSKH